MPKLLEAPVVGLTKKRQFKKKVFSKDELGHKNNFLKTFLIEI